MFSPLARVALIAATLAVPAEADDAVTTPAKGSPDEIAILDLVRAPMEQLFGKPIDFSITALTLSKDYAYVLVHPQRPDGKSIEVAAWKKVAKTCEQDLADFTVEALLHRVGGKWKFDLPANGKPSICADDTLVGEDTLKARGLPLKMILTE